MTDARPPEGDRDPDAPGAGDDTEGPTAPDAAPAPPPAADPFDPGLGDAPATTEPPFPGDPFAGEPVEDAPPPPPPPPPAPLVEPPPPPPPAPLVEPPPPAMEQPDQPTAPVPEAAGAAAAPAAGEGEPTTPPPPPPPTSPQAPVSAPSGADAVADEPPVAPLPPPPPPPPTGDTGGDELAQVGPPRRVEPWKVLALVAVLLAVGIGVFLLTDDADEESAAPGTTTTTLSDAEFVTVEDDEAGFTIQHPRSWVPLRDPAGDERLLVSAGGQNYLRIRALAVDPGADIRAGIEEGLRSEAVRVVKQQDITLNDLPGLYYLYTFTDKATRKEAVHAHYFLVRGQKMYTLVFQALPTDEFTRLAPVFDKVAESFRSTSDAPAPAPTSTTAPAEPGPAEPTTTPTT